MPEAFEFIGPRLGISILVIVTALSLIGAIILFVRIKRQKARGDYDYLYDDWDIPRWFTYAITIMFTLITVAALIPFQPKYWNEYSVEGTVVNVTNMFENGTGSLTGTQLIELDTMEDPILSDRDLRFVTKVGEEVKLTCSINWYFRAEDSYKCRLSN